MIFGIFLLTLFSDNRVVKLSSIFLKKKMFSLFLSLFVPVLCALIVINFKLLFNYKINVILFSDILSVFMHTYLAAVCNYCTLYSVDCIIYLFVNSCIKATSCAIRNLNFYSYVHIPLIKLFIEGNIILKVKIYR